MNPAFRSRLLVTEGLWYYRRSSSIRKDDNNSVPECKDQQDNVDLSIDDLTEPVNCCMSGCANCVWIKYAERLSDMIGTSDVDLQKIILEKVQDPNMRAFLLMELKHRKLIK